MTDRLAAHIGLPPDPGRAAGSRDLARAHQPTQGAVLRTKGTLILLAQVTGDDRRLARGVAETLAQIERDYYYDLSTGPLGSLDRALRNANRRLHAARSRFGIPHRASVAVVGVVLRGREALMARVGPVAALIVRGGRMYELIPPAREGRSAPPGARDSSDPPAVADEDTLGAASAVAPVTWQGVVSRGDRLALLSRNLARAVGAAGVESALTGSAPDDAVARLGELFTSAGGRGSDGRVVIVLADPEAAGAAHRPAPIFPVDRGVAVPLRHRVPLAGALGSALAGVTGAGRRARSAMRRGLSAFGSVAATLAPRRATDPATVQATAERDDRRRRRLAAAGMVALAALTSLGATVASWPAPSPTEAIPRAAAAREAIGLAVDLIEQADATADVAGVGAREPTAAARLLDDASAELGRAREAGVPAGELARLQRSVDRRLDAAYRVSRISAADTVVEVAATFDGARATELAAASDGSLWIVDGEGGRVIRVDPVSGTGEVVYRAGQAVPDGIPDEPWLVATAATDVVVVDRSRQAWRIDLSERVPRRMALHGLEGLDDRTRLIAALQHRPPLEIFNLYVVDGEAGSVLKWTPPPVIPVEYPEPPESYLLETPDIAASLARDLEVDTDLWLLHASTVTLVRFGVPRPQADYSLDRPPDAAARPRLDYRLLQPTTLGGRDVLLVYDAANSRLIAFDRADGAFVRQWLAAASAQDGLLDAVVGLWVPPVADGAPVAYLVTPTRLVRAVLE